MFVFLNMHSTTRPLCCGATTELGDHRKPNRGKLEGPWTLDETPINDDHGGHAMLFRDSDGRLMISYHAPNNAPSYPVMYEVIEDNGKLTIRK